MKNVLTIVLISLFLLMLTSTVLIIVLGDKHRNKCFECEIPDKINVVIVDKGRDRSLHQTAAIRKNMSWVNSIILIKTIESESKYIENNYQEASDIPVISLNTVDKELLSILEDTDSIGDFFIFLGDTTIPVKKTPANQLISKSGKIRIFNYLDIDARTVGFERYFEQTMPVVIINRKEMIDMGGLDLYLLSLSITSKIIYSPFINKLIILTDNKQTDNSQVESVNSHTQYFSTCLILPTLSQQSQKAMNKKVIDIFKSVI